jgi:hypothetical protein
MNPIHEWPIRALSVSKLGFLMYAGGWIDVNSSDNRPTDDASCNNTILAMLRHGDNVLVSQYRPILDSKILEKLSSL